MNNKCQFDSKSYNGDEKGTLINCPCCGHFVSVGAPHPDFSNNIFPFIEEELVEASNASEEWRKKAIVIADSMFGILTDKYK